MNNAKSLNALDLFTLTEPALRVAGPTTWINPDSEGNSEMLVFRAGHVEERPVWVLAPCDANSEDAPPASEDDLPLETSIAAALIADHLRRHLLDRGWQVQAHVRRTGTTWRLVDCLSPIDGGGDRLDADYPAGSDELEVICRSVVAVHTDICRR